MSLRILHVVRSMKPEAGAVAVLLPGLVRALNSRGFESTIASPETTDDGCGSKSSVPLTSETASRLFGDTDIVHIHGFDRELLRMAMAALRRSATAYVVSPLGGISPNPFANPSFGERIRRRFVDSKLLRGAAGIAALHDREAEQLRAVTGNQHIRIVPYGVNAAEYAAAIASPVVDNSLTNSAHKLLYLGPLHPVEGLVPLLRAVGELGKLFEDWQVVLAGQQHGRWRLKLEAAIERKGAMDRVTFVSDPNLDQQRTLLAEATILAAPALVARCPTAVLQAVASGIRVIASPEVVSPGMEEFVTVCRPGRDDLRRALELELSRTAESGRKTDPVLQSKASATCDWSARVASFVELYEAACVAVA